MKEVELFLCCKVHGKQSAYVRKSSGSLACKKCRTEAVVKRRQRVKVLLVAYKGGVCERPGCGYTGHPGVFDFHHRDPDLKEFAIAQKGHSIAFERLKKEVDKCWLLCANCHREKHLGVW
jgi:hypothetical protein